MNIPFKQMANWKTGNIAPFLLGIWYIILPFLAQTANINMKMLLFGFTFFSISLIRVKSRPTVLASLATALLGINYFLFMMTTINQNILWTLSIILFALVLVSEFDIFRFGPSSAQAKDLTIVPLTILGFAILLGIAGYNPYIRFDWSRQMLVCLNYLAVMLFCFLFVFDRIGYRPFGRSTITYMNLMAVAAVLLSVIGVYQGSLFQW
jgi:hypothetical protein